MGKQLRDIINFAYLELTMVAIVVAVILVCVVFSREEKAKHEHEQSIQQGNLQQGK